LEQAGYQRRPALAVSLMDYDLDYFDDKECRLEPIDNPFGLKLLPMSPE
jgi:putative transposase